MNPETTNGPRSESLGPRIENSRSTADSSRCEHLAKAAYWLDIAERGFGFGQSAEAAKLAELHVLLADRVEEIEECGGTDG